MIPALQPSQQRGFTLVELLIAMTVAIIILGAIYSAYTVQQKQYIAQAQVTDMQQNIRGAMSLLTRDIRMAGYDLSGEAGARLLRIEDDLLYFTSDLNNDGSLDDPGEYIVYDLYTSASSSLSTLGRASSSTAIGINEVPGGSGHYEANNPSTATHQPVAQVIEAIRFTYRDKNDTITSDPDQVRTIVVALLARAEKGDPEFVNNSSYPIGGPWPKGDHFRRRYLEMNIQCRNLGL
ncbi:MAG: prepilin-type N-terminal cleavage/methylation domain-containing protein [Desulfopila sp.]